MNCTLMVRDESGVGVILEGSRMGCLALLLPPPEGPDNKDDAERGEDSEDGGPTLDVETG